VSDVGRPLRFGVTGSSVSQAPQLVSHARRAERLGYSTFGMADHLMLPFAPLIALQAVAAATTTVRLAPTVLNQDLRHPVVVAKELATLDVLSGGRLQVGIGAGWLREEYDQSGMRFDPAAVRIERLEEVVIIVKGLLAGGRFSFAGNHFTIDALEGLPRPVQQPHPPVMIGGGGRRLLAVAARQADIIQIMPSVSGGALTVGARDFSAAAYEEKIGWVREEAGSRFGQIEIGAQLLSVMITDDPGDGYESYLRAYVPLLRSLGGSLVLSEEEFLSSPVVAVGPVDEVCAKLLAVREQFGISYFLAPVGSTPETLAAVVERLGSWSSPRSRLS
jgi:probable F420-dependent oxidoreductase